MPCAGLSASLSRPVNKKPSVPPTMVMKNSSKATDMARRAKPHTACVPANTEGRPAVSSVRPTALKARWSLK